MTVEEAAQYIAPFVKLTWPKDRDRLYNILHLAQSRAWKEGKWYGMTREYSVYAAEDNTVITPPGYDVLLKVNLNTAPVSLRDQHFQFHRNGNGSVTECCGKNWTSSVYDLGPSPVLFQPYKDTTCPDCYDDTPCVRIGVKSLGCETDASITITGFYPNACMELCKKNEHGQQARVYTYEKTTKAGTTEICGCGKEEEGGEDKKVKNGATIPLTAEISLLDIYWGRIESIAKTVTKAPVEVYAFYGDSQVKLIARLEPWQTQTHYKKYKLPEQCSGAPCIHGLFKMSQPERINNDSQLMIISEDEALLLLAKGINMTYYEDDDVNGERFILRGIKALEDQLTEQSTSAEIPIQVNGPMFQSTASLDPLTGY